MSFATHYGACRQWRTVRLYLLVVTIAFALGVGAAIAVENGVIA